MTTNPFLYNVPVYLNATGTPTVETPKTGLFQSIKDAFSGSGTADPVTVENIMHLTYLDKPEVRNSNLTSAQIEANYQKWKLTPNGKATERQVVRVVKKAGKEIKEQGTTAYFKSTKGQNLLNALSNNMQSIVDLFVGSKEAWQGEPVYEEGATEKKWLGMSPITVILLSIPVAIILTVVIIKIASKKK